MVKKGECCCYPTEYESVIYQRQKPEIKAFILETNSTLSVAQSFFVDLGSKDYCKNELNFEYGLSLGCRFS